LEQARADFDEIPEERCTGFLLRLGYSGAMNRATLAIILAGTGNVNSTMIGSYQTCLPV
jgi:hypothetical protein